MQNESHNFKLSDKHLEEKQRAKYCNYQAP